MTKSIKFIFHKGNKEETSGYVYVQIIENRERTYRSLKLPRFEEKYWDYKTQRVKKSKNIDYINYNDIIETFLSEIIKEGKSLEKFDELNNRISFLKYFERVLSSTKLEMKHGTRLKYRTVYKKLVEYLKHKGKGDLLFSQITIEFLDDLNNYMKQTGMETNSVIHYLKIIRIILRKSQKDRSISNLYDPFTRFEFDKKEKKRKETLSKDEIQYIKDFKIDNERIEKVRNLFLFQFFTGGMRVSDLTILRYNNFVNGRISYRMFKTKNEINIPITKLHLSILRSLITFKTKMSDFILEDREFKDKLDEKISNYFKVNKPTRPSPIRRDPPYFLLEKIPYSIFLEVQSYGFIQTSNFIKSLTYNELFKEYKNLLYFIENRGIIKNMGFSSDTHFSINLETKFNSIPINQWDFLSDLIKKRIEELDKLYFDNSLKELTDLGTGKKTKNSFIFKILKDKDFESIKDDNNFSNVTLEQYQKINKSGIVYNRNLKELQKLLKIEKSLKTHLPRVSFTNIMINTEGVSPHDIKETLGHSSISITDEYLKTGFNDGRVDEVISNKLGNQFS